MATKKIYLGKLVKKVEFGGEKIYLEKHSWDCGWYWGFGYVGNSNLHFHLESMVTGKAPNKACELFESTNISDDDWWVIRDLFIQAYALKKAAEVYRYGGHQTSKAGVTDIIKNTEFAKQLNADLEKILDKAWEFIQEAVKG